MRRYSEFKGLFRPLSKIVHTIRIEVAAPLGELFVESERRPTVNGIVSFMIGVGGPFPGRGVKICPA
jgi:hypothetical protein